MSLAAKIKSMASLSVRTIYLGRFCISRLCWWRGAFFSGNLRQFASYREKLLILGETFPALLLSQRLWNQSLE